MGSRLSIKLADLLAHPKIKVHFSHMKIDEQVEIPQAYIHWPDGNRWEMDYSQGESGKISLERDFNPLRYHSSEVFGILGQLYENCITFTCIVG